MPDLLSPKGPWSFLDWSNKYGRIFKVQFANGLGVVLSDPSTILRITRKTGNTRLQCAAAQGLRHHAAWPLTPFSGSRKLHCLK